jgi:hypothetical protein
VAGVADLQRLALAAVGHAPHGPLVGTPHRVERRPKCRSDAGVRGVLQHAAQPAVLDLPADLAAELEVEALVIDRPRAVGLHVDAVVGAGDHLVERRLARPEADVGHPHHGQPGRPVGPDHPARRQAHQRCRVATREHADPHAVAHDVHRLGGHALVVVAEAAHGAGQRGVGRDLHHLAAEAQAAEPGGLEPRGAGERGLPAQDPIELDGVTDRLVDLQCHLVGVEHDRRRALGALGSFQQGDRLLRHRGGAGHEVEAAHQLPPLGAVLAPHPRVRTALRLAVADGGGIDHRPALDQALADAAALTGREPLLGVPHLVAGLGKRDSGVVGGTGYVDQQVALLGQADVVERVDLPGRGPLGLHDRRRRQVERWSGDPSGGPRHRGRTLAGAAGGRGGERRCGLEPPGGPDQRPHADPRVLGLGEVLDHPVAGLHRLVPDDHDAGIGVAGAGGERRLDRAGCKLEHQSVSPSMTMRGSPVRR